MMIIKRMSKISIWVSLKVIGPRRRSNGWSSDLWSTDDIDELQHIYLKYCRQAYSREYKDLMREMDSAGFLKVICKDALKRDIVVF